MTLIASILDQLFGLQQVSWSDARTVLGWRTPLPGWAWALIVLAAVGIAGWSYHRMLGPRAARIALAAVRALLILVVAALLAGPMLVLNRERIDPDCLIILVDRSASLDIRDMQSGTQPTSRDQALKDALMRHADLFGPDKLGGEHRQVLWLGFDSATYELGGSGNGASPRSDAGEANDATAVPTANATQNQPVVPDLGPAAGERTALRTAIEQALQRVAGRPISGIVLLTDGRSPESTGADVVRRLAQHGVGVYAVPLGADTAPLDFAIADIEAPDKAFVNDIVPVNVWLEVFPADAQADLSQVMVRLIDDQTQQVLDEKPGVSLNEPVRLAAQSAAVGEVNWRVEIEYQGRTTSQPVGELITENNTELVTLELVDRPIRVLYVEGYPRWEYRYLKNMLVREQSISSSMLLLSADRQFAQEGDVPITRMPRNAEEIEPFDVIILGDVPSGYFGAELMTLIRDHVAVRGAGLLWIGGPGSTPRSYETTPLADLLPMRMPGAVDRVSELVGGVALAMRPTPLAANYNIMRLRSMGGTDADAAEADWPEELPALNWAQDLGPLKQIAEILAEGRPTSDLLAASSASEGGQPLIVRMPFGAGLSLYVATDETWRWRYGRGELYFEQFWVQLIRMLGSNRLQRDTGAAKLTISNRRVERDRAVVVELLVRDEAILRRNPTRVAVDVMRADDPRGQAIERIELMQEFGSTTPGEDVAADPMTISRGRLFRTLWQPTTTGSLRLRVVEQGLTDLELTDTIEVYHGDDEKRQPLPDHDRLVTLAEQTGGKVIPLNQLEELAGLIPNRQTRTPDDIREPLWDSYVSLILVLLLLTVEWVGRKIIRLV